MDSYGWLWMVKHDNGQLWRAIDHHGCCGWPTMTMDSYGWLLVPLDAYGWLLVPTEAYGWLVGPMEAYGWLVGPMNAKWSLNEV